MPLTSATFFSLMCVQIHKPIKAFHYGPPDGLNELAIMFDKANVDGLSSVIAGVDNEEVEETQIEEDMHELYKEEYETQVPSPVQPSPVQPSPAQASKKCNSL